MKIEQRFFKPQLITAGETMFFKMSSRNKSNRYHFRGPINIRHLIDDCIKDGKHGFLAIGETVIMGVSKQFIYVPLNIDINAFDSYNLPFYVSEIARQDIPEAMEFLKTLNKEIKAQIRARSKKLAADKKAGKFSNAKITKVMVF